MSSKRVAYVGLSSVNGFDFAHLATPTQNDTREHLSPNPYYIGGFGMLLLYDELWFLCESLCPENMRHLAYVHFVDQEFSSHDIAEIYHQVRHITTYLPNFSSFFDYLSSNESISYYNSLMRESNSLRRIRDKVGFPFPNGSHTLVISGIRFHGRGRIMV